MRPNSFQSRKKRHNSLKGRSKSRKGRNKTSHKLLSNPRKTRLVRRKSIRKLKGGIRFLKQKGPNDKDMKLLIAAQNGDTEVVEEMLKNKANINMVDSSGNTPLHLAAGNGREGVVDLLLKHKANIKAGNNFEETPLHYATREGHEGVVKMLLDKEAQSPKEGEAMINKISNDFTPLHIATHDSFQGRMQDARIRMVNLLLEKGANPNIHDSSGQTPLHLAAGNGDADVVQALLENGVLFEAVQKKDIFGKTPLDIAVDAKQVLEREKRRQQRRFLGMRVRRSKEAQEKLVSAQIEGFSKVIELLKGAKLPRPDTK